MRCVDKGSIENYCPFDTIANFLNINNFDALYEQETEDLEYYMNALQRHYKMVSSILEYRKYGDISYFEECPANFEKFKNMKKITKNANFGNTDYKK